MQRFVRCALLVAAGLLATSGPARAQVPLSGDTEFWFAPPDVTDVLGSSPLYVVVVAGDAPATVTVALPANPAFTPSVVDVPARDQKRIDVTAARAQLETRPTNTIVGSGLRVTSTTPITAAYEVANAGNLETWQLHGRLALGQEFFIPMHRHAPFFNESVAAPNQALATFDIVATQANARVTIYSPTPLDGHPALQQFSVTLNRGQAYSAGFSGANSTQPATHPSGAIVLADQPVAITIKDDSIHNPGGTCIDLTGAQLVPVSALGQQFIVPKGLLGANADESVFVTATQNDTQVFQGGSLVATLFAGEFLRIDIDALSPSFAGVAIAASKPVYASHLTGLGCEAALALLPPYELAGTRFIDITRTSGDDFHLLVATRASSTATFVVSGAGTATLPASAFKLVSGSASWRAARVQLDTTQFPVGSTLHIENVSDRFIAAQLAGNPALGASYDWTTPYNAAPGIQAIVTSATTIPEPGGLVPVSVRVFNTGLASAELLDIQDPQLGGSVGGFGNCSFPATIAPGTSFACNFDVNLVGVPTGSSYAFNLTASAFSRDTAITAFGTSSVTVVDVLPTISVVTTASPAVVEPGDTVTFTVVVRNTGTAEPVTLASLVDDVVGSLAGVGTCAAGGTIAPGASTTCNYTAVASGANNSAFARTVSATATDDEANVATASGTGGTRVGALVFANGFED